MLRTGAAARAVRSAGLGLAQAEGPAFGAHLDPGAARHARALTRTPAHSLSTPPSTKEIAMSSLASLSKRVFSLGLVALAFLGAGAAQAQNALDGILKTKTVKIAIPTDYPPYGFVGADMAPQGLDI